MTRAALALVAALAAGGCSSQYLPGFEKHDVAHSDLVVRTEPEGAEVYVNGAKQSAVSPIRIPVNYNHTETVYERQTNAGAAMREDMGPIMTIVSCPVWLVASIFHYREETRRHEYGGNVMKVRAYLPGHDEAEQTVTLEGEAVIEVKLVLPAR